MKTQRNPSKQKLSKGGGSWEFRLERDPRFLNRIAKARESLRAGRGVKLEDIED